MAKIKYCTLCKREVATRKLNPIALGIGLVCLVLSAFTGIGFLLGLFIFGLVWLIASYKCMICGTTALTPVEGPEGPPQAPRTYKPIRNYLGEVKPATRKPPQD